MLSDGKSFNAICKDTHSSKTTVSNYKKLVEGTKLPYVELLEKSDSELEQLLSSQLSNRVGGKRSSFLPTFVFRPLTPPYVPFGIRRFLFWIPFEIRIH